MKVPEIESYQIRVLKTEDFLIFTKPFRKLREKDLKIQPTSLMTTYQSWRKPSDQLESNPSRKGDFWSQDRKLKLE